jgi:hypothetical protein
VPRFSPINEEFFAQLKEFEREWQEVGLIGDDGNFQKSARTALSIVAKDHTYVIAKGLAYEGPINARLVLGNQNAVLIEQDDDHFTFTMHDVATSLQALLEVLPELNPGPGSSSRAEIAPEQAEEEAWDDQWGAGNSYGHTNNRSSYRRSADRQREKILTGAKATGEFRIGGRDQHNSRVQSHYSLSWIDTLEGRYTAWYQSRADGSLVATYEPAHPRSMAAKLTQAVDGIR